MRGAFSPTPPSPVPRRWPAAPGGQTRPLLFQVLRIGLEVLQHFLNALGLILLGFFGLRLLLLLVLVLLVLVLVFVFVLLVLILLVLLLVLVLVVLLVVLVLVLIVLLVLVLVVFLVVLVLVLIVLLLLFLFLLLPERDLQIPFGGLVVRAQRQRVLVRLHRVLVLLQLRQRVPEIAERRRLDG